MSSPKYYMQVEEEATYPDSTCMVFYADRPFDTEQDAKRAADEHSGAVFHAVRIVFECRDNILKHVAIRGFGEAWQVWGENDGADDAQP